MRRAFAVTVVFSVAALAAAVLPLASGVGAAERGAGTDLEVSTGSRMLRAEVDPGSLVLGGRPCSLVPVPQIDAAAPVGVLGGCEGVRPGGVVASEVGLCTFNFLFSGSDGRRYMGTAGHCVLSQATGETPVPERTWAIGEGPVASDAGKRRIGEFAYAVKDSPKDFALVRLDRGVEASPEMCFFGGPTGYDSDVNSDIDLLQYYGNGIGIGDAVPGRSAVVVGKPSPDHVFALGLVLPGDSGSGVISSDGRAVGVVVTTGLHGGTAGTDGIDFGTVGITRIEPQVLRAERQLGIRLTLQTAPVR